MFSNLFPKRIMVILSAATMLLAACSDNRGGPIPYDIRLAAPDAPSIVPLDAGYKIAPLDKLTINADIEINASDCFVRTAAETMIATASLFR